MYQEAFTITRHRNGYFEIRNCFGCILSTADNRKEAETDKKQYESGLNFADVLQEEIAKIS